MKVDGRFEVLLVAETTGGVLHPLHLRVDGFTAGIGDAMPEVRNNIVESALEHSCLGDYRHHWRGLGG